MKITVIVPLFNSSEFINDSIESILSQTYQDFELILVDDFSTDDTLSIVNEYKQKYNIISVLTNQYAKGISGAMNTGLDNAKGELIAYLDHDDIALPNRFELQVKFFAENPSIGVCGTWMQEFDGGDSVWSFPMENEDIKAITLLHSPIANPTAMLRKEILDKSKIRYKSEYDTAQDYEFWLQLLPHTEFANIPEVLVKYRIHKSNASTVLGNKQYESWKKAITPYIEKLGIICDEFLFETLYNMKYPNFYKKYKHQQNLIDSLINEILIKNDGANLFPPLALRKLFQQKIKAWNEKSIE